LPTKSDRAPLIATCVAYGQNLDRLADTSRPFQASDID
jgi:hypothetical protein